MLSLSHVCFRDKAAISDSANFSTRNFSLVVEYQIFDLCVSNYCSYDISLKSSNKFVISMTYFNMSCLFLTASILIISTANSYSSPVYPSGKPIFRINAKFFYVELILPLAAFNDDKKLVHCSSVPKFSAIGKVG